MSAPVVFLIIVLVVCATSWGAATAVPTNADDAAAMQSIANSTGAAKSLGWGVRSLDPCAGTWSGVRCGDTGRVTSINASRGGLTGMLDAADLSLLTSLVELDLSFNDFRLELPKPSQPLAGLRTLDFRSNNFVDIPDGFFSSFPALEMFAIDDIDLSDALVLKDDVATCSDLRSFSANNVNMNDVFPNIFGNASLFPELESLSLARNQLWGVIDLDFGKNGKINFQDVGAQHSISDSKLGGILRFITGMENLVELRVDHNSFGPLPDATHLVNLRSVNAAANDLCGIPKFPAGTDVDLDGNPNVGKEC
ncbi:hypothetical protein BAE44_0014391 [Dichanthelium oligosanthes]|uniref:Leucine-rich repeat-containing N-terminal plant-type domain-containing protein n=1 Tax=Dichanthelium oligosanthes TaxID=888268 RepID=A0A1E5VHI7_9POAL|nr:hypothetical protein BAE44_0014391 [Dichanthelium oligosanthes]